MEISIPTLTGSTSNELWKLKTHAWTVVTYLNDEKQAKALSLSLPEGDKNKIKENLLGGENNLNDQNCENGISLLLDF